MKRLTLFVAALMVAASSFAKIEYELNGGVTNESNWYCPQDMYDTLISVVRTAFPSFTAEMVPLDTVRKNYFGNGTIAAHGYGVVLETLLDDPGFIKHFAWMEKYFDDHYVWYASTHAGVSASTMRDNAGSPLRYYLTGFFFNAANPGYPYCDFTSTGVKYYDAYKDYWKHAFLNPEEATDSVALYPPYKEGMSFDGWYDNAEFEGDEITHISSATTATKLYAKWIEIIPTISEVIALADDTETKTTGTVSYVEGAEFWIQDVDAGIMCFQADHGLVAGDKVVLTGKKVTYGGIPELKNIAVVKKTAGETVNPQVVVLSDILADTIAGKLTSRLVKVEGVRVKYVTSGEYTNPTLYDGIFEVPCYKVTLDQTAIPEGSKVSAVLVVSEYNGQKQFRGDAATFEVAASAAQDPYAYAEVADSVSGYKFQLTNNWLYSVNMGNWNGNKPNPLAEGSRSILHKDGILYFSYRESNSPINAPYIVRVNAKTGEMLSPVYFADDMFKKNGSYIFGPFTDMKMDNAGNVIVSSLPTAGGDFQIWTVDLETGAGTLLIDHTDSASYLKNLLPDIPVAIRLDRIGVYGDITKDATIMSIISAGADVLYWNIVDGEWDGDVNWIKLQMDGNVGGAPTICPIADNYFYVDGNSTRPMLFDPDGNLVDNLSDYDTLITGLSGKAFSTGNCGVLEIEVNGDYYFICAGNPHGTGSPESTFFLYKFKDENRAFGEMTFLYEFPHAGMGGTSNPQRVATPYATVAEDGKSIELYVFTAENGYGVYTLNIEYPVEDGLENVTSDDAKVQKVLRDGQVVIIRNGVEYNVLGTQVK